MKKTVRKVLAKVVTAAMLLSTVVGIGTAKSAKAADLSSYLNMEFGIKYTGQTTAEVNSSGDAWNIQYFNVADSAYETGDEFYVSCKISGASNFKQIAMQSSVNNWDWTSAPKKWSNSGTADNTVVAGKMKATQNGTNLSFKIQLDNVVDTAEAVDQQSITLTDLYIMKLSDADQTATAIPESKQLALGTKYTGTVAANENDGVYEAQYFNVSDSSYSAGDTYIISYTLGGATGFKQVATQANLNSWSWDAATKVWAGDGLATAQDVIGDFVASSSGNGVSFKVRLDTLVDDTADLGSSLDLTFTDLVVVKVSNDSTVALPSSLQISKDRNYSGTVSAVKGTDSWNVQYFNVNDSAYAVGDQIKISFDISGASDFKQLVLQTSANNWSWDSAPKIWSSNGIADGTTMSAIITATQAADNLSFKLWLDNPVEDGFDTTPVEMSLANLQVKDIEVVASLDEAYADYFSVGAAVSASMVQDVEYQNRIKGVFGTITAENEMKPDALLNQAASQAATDGKPVLNLEYSGMTTILDFAKENGLKVRGHALIYAAQTPDWFFHVGYTDDGANVSASVLESRMESYIKQVVEFVDTNYPGVVTSWDVVNEALEDDGTYKSNNWYTIMGKSYVTKAFEYASQYASTNSKLYYNDYNLEASGKQTEVLDIITNVLLGGSRIDGIGMQEHVTLTYPTVTNIQSAIEYYANLNMDVQITELDVQIDEDQTLSAQADRYEALFNLFKNKSASISNVTLWGINDGSSWKSAKRPLLFYDDLTPKPAFDSVLGLVTE